MPPYAGFRNLTEYIDARLARLSTQQGRPATRHRLSLNLGKSSNYVHGLCNGQFTPSPDMVRELAAAFVDSHDEQALAGEAHIVGVLCGLESIPPNDEARALADRIMSLNKKQREMAVAFVEFLASRK